MRFFCVTRPRLEAVNRSLEAACRARGIEFVGVSPSAVWRPFAGAPVPGDLLYRAAADIAAERVEALLIGPGVATFHVAPGFVCSDPLAAFVRAGLPTPRTVFNLVDDPEVLAGCVEALGGFPLVLKLGGTEGGRGVIRVDDETGLSALAARHSGAAVLQAFVEHERAFRLVVVGERVVAAEEMRPAPGDFRSNGAGATSRGDVPPPAGAGELACAAVELIGLEFGGVDVLVDTSGELVLAEANFPCYFPGTEQVSGVDIAGAMLDHLLTRSAEGPAP